MWIPTEKKLIKGRTTARKGNVTNRTNKTDVLFEGLLYHSCGKKLVIDRNRKNEPFFRCKSCKGNPDIVIKKSFVGLPLMNNINEELKDYKLTEEDKTSIDIITIEVI